MLQKYQNTGISTALDNSEKKKIWSLESEIYSKWAKSKKFEKKGEAN